MDQYGGQQDVRSMGMGGARIGDPGSIGVDRAPIGNVLEELLKGINAANDRLEALRVRLAGPRPQPTALGPQPLEGPMGLQERGALALRRLNNLHGLIADLENAL